MTVQGFQLQIAGKNPCRAATTANVADLAAGAPDPVDGVALAVGNRILVKDQSSGAENGIYVVDTVGSGSNGAWSRASDMEDVTEDRISAGLSTYVQEGTAATKKTYALTTTGTIILDTTVLVFEVASTAGASGIGGATGSTDNAVLRADGAGGATIQASDVVLDDNENYTGIASVGMDERASAPTVATGDGAFWVRDDLDPAPIFTEGDNDVDKHLLHWNPVKRPCRVATTADVANTAAGAPDPVDGVSLAVGDRVLVWNQDSIDADPENGIYTVTTVGTGADGVWARADDWDNGTKDHLTAGNEVYVQEGSLWARTKFIFVTTGAVTIGATATEFIPEGGLARTDASSTEIIASTAFTSGTFVVDDSGFTDMRDHTHIAVFFDPTSLGSNTIVDLVVFWSDDGTTIPFATDDNILQTDFDIVNQADGSYNPKPYTARLTTAGSELVVNQKVHLVFPKGGGACKVGVKGNNASGAFNVRVQRLVR